MITARTWQLVMAGDGLHRITAEAQADMARLLDLDPSISHLTIEVGDDRIHVGRDWPSDRMEEADHLIERIAASSASPPRACRRSSSIPDKTTHHDG